MTRGNAFPSADSFNPCFTLASAAGFSKSQASEAGIAFTGSRLSWNHRRSISTATPSAQFVLDPVKAIPASEAWLFEKPAALASVKQGLKESAEGNAFTAGHSRNSPPSDPAVQRKIEFTTTADRTTRKSGNRPRTGQRRATGEEGPRYLETDPNHPGLNSHEFTSLKGANGEKIFEAVMRKRYARGLSYFLALRSGPVCRQKASSGYHRCGNHTTSLNKPV